MVVAVECLMLLKLLEQHLAEELKIDLESGLSLVDNSSQAGLHSPRNMLGAALPQLGDAHAGRAGLPIRWR